MAHYLVRAKPIGEKLPDLRAQIDSGWVKELRPFGSSLNYSLLNARLEPNGWAVWEEEDYCSPPLKQERSAVLDNYFTDLSVEPVKKGAGWEKIESLPSLWDK